MFEVGVSIVDTTTGAGVQRVVPLGLYPMLVVPSEITYDDTSRTPITQTLGALEATKSGRAPYGVSLRGTFGVEARGVPPYGGTGEERYQRFWDQVVRFSDAATKGAAAEALQALFVLPVAKELARNYDPFRMTPYVNFYDLYNKRRFSCVIRSFQPKRSYRGGGATGLVAYQMRVEESGPVVASTLVDGFLEGLLDGMAIWQSVNDEIQAFSIPAFVGAVTGVPMSLLTEFRTTLESVQANLPAATETIGSTSYASRTVVQPGVGSIIGESRHLQDLSEDIAARLGALTIGSIDPPAGAIDWTTLSARSTSPDLDLYDAVDDFAHLADLAAHQLVAGVFSGMSRDEYAALVVGSDLDTAIGGSMTGSRSYVVTDLDTAERIEAITGVDFERLLAVNRLLPDEALTPGRVLQLPISQPNGQASLLGLPTFDSHLGEAAWGSDLTVGLDTLDGDFAAISGQDVLVQGVQWLIDELEGMLIGQSGASIPEGVEAFAASHIRTLVASDRRIERIDELTVDVSSTALTVELTVAAIHGGYVGIASGAQP